MDQPEGILLPKKKKKIDWKEFFSFRIWDVVAIAAIIFAYIQFHDAKKTLETLPTKYMADFPENMEGIIEKVITQAQHNLTIIADYPIYGIYSNSKKAAEYRAKIINKTIEADLHLVFYNYETRKQQFFDQFHLDKEKFDDTAYFKEKFLVHSCGTGGHPTGNINFKCRLDKMENFIETFNEKKMPTTCRDFFEIMNKHHEAFMRDLKINGSHNVVTIDTISYQLSSAFWLSDNSVLAFSMNSLGKDAQESTFITHDPSIIGFVIKTYDNLTK